VTATNVPSTIIEPAARMAARSRKLHGMKSTYTVIALLCAVLLLGLAACEREGPAEKAGRQLDEAARDVRDAVKGK
jgi:hypothetical protein